MANIKVAIDRRRGGPASEWVLHMIEACPDRVSLPAGAFDQLEVGAVELSLLKSRHKICPTCQHLDVASSVDRVRFLLSGMTKRAS